jgi:DNA-binding GntR family transcriptional regulator
LKTGLENSRYLTPVELTRENADISRNVKENIKYKSKTFFMEKSLSLRSLNSAESLPRKLSSCLEEAILHGGIKPGSRLMEGDLSNQLGISRGPIREAFRLMEKDGLIKMIPRKGAIVHPISQEDVSEIFEIISVLEGLAGRLLCERGTKEELARLQKIYKGMEDQIKKNNLLKYQKLNMEFHDAFINASSNKRIEGLYRKFQKQIQLFLRVHLSFVQRPEISLKEHKRLLGAISKRDSKRAEYEAREHVNRVAKIYLQPKSERG